MSLLIENANELERIELEDGEWIEIPAVITFEMQQGLSPSSKDFKIPEYQQQLLMHTIKKWSAVDVAGAMLPVTPDNLKKLPMKAATAVMERIHEKMGLKKTNLGF